MGENQTKLIYKIAITLIPGVGSVTAKRLISICGSAEAVFKESPSGLQKINGINQKIINSIRNKDLFHLAEKEIGFIERNDILILYYLDENYPFRLKQCADSPILLYIKGSTNLSTKRIIAIVGTRKPTSYGRDQCEKIVQGLSDYNVLIVSGLAYGIDTVAHQCALKYGLPTIAVLGHSLDRIYPSLNISLAKKILRDGALLTEFISGTKPDRENFPKRNRIVAGMVDGVIVIESAERGGALITADIALSYNREVMTIPGRVNDDLSGGCNWLIIDNKAALVRNATDVLKIMNWDIKGKYIQKELNFDELDDRQRKIMRLLYEYRKINVDQLVALSGFKMQKLPAILLELEMKGLIRSYPGNSYEIF